MREDNDLESFDPDVDAVAHKKLIENVLNLSSRQQIKKPSRTEPTSQISEFSVVKSGTGNKGAVHLQDLTKVLKQRSKHVQIEKKVRSLGRKTTTLPKPLEKPQMERIRRGIGFQKTKHLLDRWDAVVTSRRAASHVSFPFSFDASEVGGDEIPQYRLKTDIDKRLEELGPQTEVIEVESQDKFPLTMEEIVERRKETAKMRAVQSYKEAKARRQNKIKSKKFHRILRHEKIKKQLKEFEELQKSNPEEALKKLETIERARVEERMSLRHKGTGKWAKNKQVRAKYDKDTRKVLAQQLTLSRDLTQKIDINANDDSDEEPNTDMTFQSTNYQDNPWVGPLATSAEINDFVSGYRKFWDAKNSSAGQVNEESPVPQAADKNNECLEQEVLGKNEGPIIKKKPAGLNTKKNKQVKSRVRTTCGTSNWVVTSAEKVDDIFDNLQLSLDQQLAKKYRKLQANLVPSKKKKTKKQKAQSKKKSVTDLSFPKSKSKAIIDEELITNDNSKSSELERLNSILSKTEVQPPNIDPSTSVKISQPVNLETEIPDPLTLDENENDNQKDIILEAFEDDDVVDEFQKSKKDVVNKDVPKDVNLTLPGWGTWDGCGLPVSNRKNTRFIVKFPKKIPRRDDNKGNLIIYEDSSAKVKSHQVNEVPFPFTKVKDFEASIRAPIGNTFVPELAFRKMIRPAVTTKAGTIIEPLTTDVLLKKKYV